MGCESHWYIIRLALVLTRDKVVTCMAYLYVLNCRQVTFQRGSRI